ncbi:Beta-glucosidase 1B [Tephrocybe rancida]|nr:Beta-glucosidase 1B [Tephrocybe rancida]
MPHGCAQLHLRRILHKEKKRSLAPNTWRAGVYPHTSLRKRRLGDLDTTPPPEADHETANPFLRPRLWYPHRGLLILKTKEIEVAGEYSGWSQELVLPEVPHLKALLSSEKVPRFLQVPLRSMAATSTSKLPAEFLWGFATAAFQIEGSAAEGGRGKSIWDDFAKTPGKTLDGRNGDVATDSYRLWKEDVALLAQYGIKAYRFSISWSRIIPEGGREDKVNEEGVRFYSDLIDALLEHGITPFVTLYHWDLPQALHDRYGGWLNKDEVVKDYVNYTRVCFEAFGDRVKHWCVASSFVICGRPSDLRPRLTINEPWCVAILGYGRGVFAPGRSSDRSRSPEGNSSTEPWIVGHSLLIAHANAVKLYRESFKPTQGGEIGITLNGDWQMPYDDSPENVDAAQHALDFSIGWYADPIYLGHYPPYMTEVLGDRQPTFTAEELEIVKGSSDFYGMNTYTTNLARAGGDDEFQGNVDYTFTRPDGTQLGIQGLFFPLMFLFCMKLTFYVPDSALCLVARFVTENGFAVKDENDMPLEQALVDTDRVNYFAGTTRNLLAAIKEDGVEVRSYFPWSFLDNFEWADGYLTRFGVTYVDYETQKRYPKASANFLIQWFKDNHEQPLAIAPTPTTRVVTSSNTSETSMTKANPSTADIPEPKQEMKAQTPAATAPSPAKKRSLLGRFFDAIFPFCR